MIDRVIMTGPTGAIGMAMIKKCLERRIPVVAICHRGSPRNQYIPDSPLITKVEAELDELDGVDVSCDKGYNIFYHLAWNGTFGDTRNDMQLQVNNIANVLKAVTLAERMGCVRFIGAGSQAEYGRVEGLLRPDTPTNPENGYGMAKLCAGQMSRKVCEQKGIEHIWTRILSVYGPYDRKETMVCGCLSKMLKGESTAFTPGEQLWDYLYSEDAAEAMLRLGELGRNGQVYCIGSGQAKPLKEYILEMKRLTGYEREVGIGAISYARGQVMELCADIEKLTEDTGFIPVVSFTEGIQKTIEWIIENEKN